MSPSKRNANLFLSQCPSRTILDILAEKWALLIIHSLSQSPKRTAELRRHIDGISEKMLIQTLRNLERHGIVSRHAYPQVPPRVDYRLTTLGQRLAQLVNSLDTWIEENLSEIMAARAVYDHPPSAGREAE